VFCVSFFDFLRKDIPRCPASSAIRSPPVIGSPNIIEKADWVYIVDVVAVDDEPGTVLRYGKEDFMLNRIPVKLSPQQAGVQEMLLVSEMRRHCPGEIYLLGVIPVSMEPGERAFAAIGETACGSRGRTGDRTACPHRIESARPLVEPSACRSALEKITKNAKDSKWTQRQHIAFTPFMIFVV